MEKTESMKQVGVIVFGPDIVAREWIERAKAEGVVVQIEENKATLWK